MNESRVLHQEGAPRLFLREICPLKYTPKVGRLGAIIAKNSWKLLTMTRYLPNIASLRTQSTSALLEKNVIFLFKLNS